MGPNSGRVMSTGSLGITYVRQISRGRVSGGWLHLKVVVKDHSASRMFRCMSSFSMAIFAVATCHNAKQLTPEQLVL